MATATATPTLENSARASAEKRISAAWDAFDNHRPELGSKLVWEAAEAVLRELARQHDYAIDDPGQRLEFARLLDAKNGGDGYYINRLLMCEYFEDNAETGVMPGSDPTTYVPVATRFINHLVDLIEGAP